MTGPQQSRPSPRPRHGRADDDFPDNSYQGGGGYPDLRASRPVERPTPSSGTGYEDLYGGTGPQPVIDDAAGYGAGDAGGAPARPAYGEYGDPASRGGTAIDGGPDHPVPATAPSGAGPGTTGQETAGPDDGGPRPDHDTADATGPVEYARAAPVTAPAPSAGTGRAAEPATAEVPAPRGAPEGGRRPATVAEAAAARFGAPAAAPTSTSGPGEGGGATGPAAGVGAAAGGATVAAGAAPARGDARHGEAAPTEQVTGGQPTGERPGGERRGPGRQQAEGRQHEGPQQQGRQHGGRQGHTAAPAPVVAKDPTAVTVLRVITYVLVSLSCLVFLAGVVYGVVAWFELREALSTSPLFGGPSVFGG